MKKLIRYRVKAESVQDNERLVSQVFDALTRAAPAGLSYATFKEADGRSFVHIVSYEDNAGNQALTSLPAFKEFSAGIGQRCEQPPVVVDLTQIGAYRMFGN